MARTKHYLAHVFMIRNECPYTWDDMDIMDWNDKRPLLAKYVKGITVEFSSSGADRDEKMEEQLQRLIKQYADYYVSHHDTPRFRGW